MAYCPSGETLWQLGHRNVGTVVQAYLLHSDADVRRLNALGARVRQVKGAYREPRTVAWQQTADVDGSFVRLMQRLLDGTKRNAEARGCPKDRFEFQMLYGIRRDLQAALLAEGYRVRVYVPYGKDRFAYVRRRLGERPSSVAFVLRACWGADRHGASDPPAALRDHGNVTGLIDRNWRRLTPNRTAEGFPHNGSSTPLS